MHVTNFNSKTQPFQGLFALILFTIVAVEAQNVKLNPWCKDCLERLCPEIVIGEWETCVPCILVCTFFDKNKKGSPGQAQQLGSSGLNRNPGGNGRYKRQCAVGRC